MSVAQHSKSCLLSPLPPRKQQENMFRVMLFDFQEQLLLVLPLLPFSAFRWKYFEQWSSENFLFCAYFVCARWDDWILTTYSNFPSFWAVFCWHFLQDAAASFYIQKCIHLKFRTKLKAKATTTIFFLPLLPNQLVVETKDAFREKATSRLSFITQFCCSGTSAINCRECDLLHRAQNLNDEKRMYTRVHFFGSCLWIWYAIRLCCAEKQPPPPPLI